MSILSRATGAHWRVRWAHPIRDIIGAGIAYQQGGVEGVAAYVAAAQMEPDEPPELAELRRRLASPQGYSEHEIEQMRAALTQALGIQRDQAIASMRQRLNAQGLAGSGMEQQQIARINSAYADALARGMADIMARSAGAGREDWQRTAATTLGYEQLAFQQQQGQQQLIGQASQGYAATQGGGGQAAPPVPSPFAGGVGSSQPGYGSAYGPYLPQGPQVSTGGGYQTPTVPFSQAPTASRGQPGAVSPFAGGLGSSEPGYGSAYGQYLPQGPRLAGQRRIGYQSPPQAPYPNWLPPGGGYGQSPWPYSSRYGGRPYGGGY